jgi:predicted RNA methylase
MTRGLQQRILRTISRSPAQGASKDLESYFHERLRESAKVLQRFASVRFIGKQVLDFGSGLGNAAFLIARLGAAKVVGVEPLATKSSMLE